jgi:hypothetical protein
MSAEVGIVCYEKGELATLPNAVILGALEPFIEEREEDYWVLSFPDGGGGEMEALGDESGFDLCIGDPSGGDLFDALFEILRQTHTLLWWPGGDRQVTADPHITDHLPPGFVAESGEPILVASGADILAEIAKT